jgi:hypothetical protein
MSLKSIPTDDLLAELARRDVTNMAAIIKNGEKYIETQPLMDRWHVTTEGERGATKDLGLHEGHIVDIAASLAPFANYVLDFTPFTPERITPARAVVDRCEVHIRPPDYPHCPRPIRQNECHAFVTGWLLKGEEVPKYNTYEVKESSHYGAVILNITPHTAPARK